ncbi:MAG: hypothetical protein U0835_09965 [Isosphaeraceae bacterium]
MKDWVDRGAIAVGLSPVFGSRYMTLGAICIPDPSTTEPVSTDVL